MQAPTYYYAPWNPPTLASDSDRERTADLLRGHWLEGRLTLEDLEARQWEAMNARYVSDLWWTVRELPMPLAAPIRPVVAAAPEPQQGSAVTSVVLSTIGLGLLLVSFGFFAFLSLPFSGAGWLTGRSARRAAAGRPAALATTGEVLGVLGTVGGCLAVAACAAIAA